jgi:UDP-glucose 4-epimerase
MKCLVTGATGFIGAELVHRLRARGLQVECCGRELPGQEQLVGIQLVFHCAGIAHRAASEAEYEAHNYQATLALARRAADAGARRFVFLSSVNASEAEDPYGYWKQRTENALIDGYGDSAMGAVVVRPALVYGAGARGNLRRLIRLVQRGMPTPPPGRARSMIGLPDLCEALCLLTEIDPGHGRILCATDGQSYTLARLHAAIARSLGREPGPPRWPPWCWRVACSGLDLLRGRPGSGQTHARLFEGREYDNAEIRATLSWQPRDSFEDLLPQMLAEPAP